MKFKKGLLIFVVFICVSVSTFAQDRSDKLTQNQSLRKIEVNEDTVFFNPVDGTPLLYYFNIGSNQQKLVFPTLTTKVMIDNVECYPEIMNNFGGIRFINHNDYNVRIYFRLTDGSEAGIWVLTAGERFWTNYHYSSIVSIRVEKLI